MDEEIFNDLSQMLGNSNFQDSFQNIISNFSSNNQNNNEQNYNNESNENNSNFNNINNFDFSNIDMETIMKIKNIMSKMNTKNNDPRSNLLMSLKPYLKPSRKEKLDQYVKFMNISSAINIINNVGGDNNK